MSRRPSSITLTTDETTILCADKFGDVYALPLLPSPDEEKPEAPVASEPVEEEEEAAKFTPSATVLTVHSGRNRRTLEEQQKQKAKNKLKTKDAVTFKHDLLLGHVSMLTDLATLNVQGRNYIISADRDEHIRISRGVPQAHIIEGFCFGHKEFISKLCLTKRGVLVSGGGDAELYVWDVLKYTLLAKMPLRDTALAYLKSQPDLDTLVKDEAGFKVAVSGIWAIPSNSDDVSTVLFYLALLLTGSRTTRYS
jgi:tRNA (guanine-N(7)-)-methyltransferase subunit TRM82